MGKYNRDSADNDEWLSTSKPMMTKGKFAGAHSDGFRLYPSLMKHSNCPISSFYGAKTQPCPAESGYTQLYLAESGYSAIHFIEAARLKTSTFKDDKNLQAHMCGILLKEIEVTGEAVKKSAGESICTNAPSNMHFDGIKGELKERIRRRGRDFYKEIQTGNLLLISSVLAVRGSCCQPIVTPNYILQYNGEIYSDYCTNGTPNSICCCEMHTRGACCDRPHRECDFSDTLRIKGIIDRHIKAEDTPRCCDDVILNIYTEINKMEAEMAIAITTRDFVYFFKDDVGRRSFGYSLSPFSLSSTDYENEIDPCRLYVYSRSNGQLHSIMKSSSKLLEGYRRFLSLRATGKDINDDARGKDINANDEDIRDFAANFIEIFESACARRLPQGNIVILFSGGIDSLLMTVSILRLIDTRRKVYLINTSFKDVCSKESAASNDCSAEAYLSDCSAEAYLSGIKFTNSTSATDSSSDRFWGRKGYSKILQEFQNREIYLIENDITLEQVVSHKNQILELISPRKRQMDFNIGAILYFSAMEAAKYGRVLFTGSGADEVFCGYFKYYQAACSQQIISSDDEEKMATDMLFRSLYENEPVSHSLYENEPVSHSLYENEPVSHSLYENEPVSHSIHEKEAVSHSIHEKEAVSHSIHEKEAVSHSSPSNTGILPLSKAFNGLLDKLAFRKRALYDLFTISSNNIARDDRVISNWGVEARFPFLDTDLVLFSLEVPDELLVMRLDANHGGNNQNPDDASNTCNTQAAGKKNYWWNKYLLRLALRKLGFGDLSYQQKKAMQFGTGLQKFERHFKIV